MKQLVFSIVLLTLVGCHSFKSNQVPADLISRDSMVVILIDIHVADAIADQKFGQDHPNRAFTNALYDRIFENHHVNAKQYKASYKYYEAQPELMDKMYEQVITEISKKEADLKKAQ